MIKRTIKYTDYKGNEREEDFYFNFSQPELMEMELTTKGGMSEYLEKIIKAQDREELIKWFKVIVLKAYGEKSEDGRRFIKSPELSEAFSQTEAFVQLYMELATDDEKAAEFVNGITPKFDNLSNAAPGKAPVDGVEKPEITVAK